MKKKKEYSRAAVYTVPEVPPLVACNATDVAIVYLPASNARKQAGGQDAERQAQ